MLLKAFLVFIIPTAALLVGVAVFSCLPEHKAVQRRVSGPGPLHWAVTPLNQRLKGYSVAEAKAYWALLAGDVASERHMLKVDLAFPVAYGVAFATALLLAWSTLAWSVNPVWLLAPVAVLVAADWTENIVQLGQLARLNAKGEGELSATWIGVASLATQLKLAMLLVCTILTIGSAGCLVEHHFRRAF